MKKHQIIFLLAAMLWPILCAPSSYAQFNPLEKIIKDATGIKTPGQAIRDEGEKVVRKALGDSDCSGDICQAYETLTNHQRNTFNEAVNLITTGKCGGDICDHYISMIDDIEDESRRFGDDLEDAGKAIEDYLEAQYKGTIDSQYKYIERVREGKIIEAFWHHATDPIANTEDAAANAALESEIIAAIGQVAATAYGPYGAAAYASWLTYKATGDFDLALKTGVIAGATSYGMGEAGNIPDTTKRALVTGAISGASVAVSGGDDTSVLDAFVMGAGMVVVQDQYKDITGHSLDKEGLKPAKGPAYCLAFPPSLLEKEPTNPCIPTEDVFVRDTDGKIVFSDNKPVYKDNGRNLMAKLDRNRPHIGIQATGPNGGWDSETGTPAKVVSQIPGFNAMSVMHDQVSIDMNLEGLALKASIPPAIVITYIGTGGPVLDQIRDSNIENSRTNGIPENISFGSNVSGAITTSSFLCAVGTDVREIALEYPVSNSDEVCRVTYKKAGSFQTLWRAKNDVNYCKPRFTGFVASMITLHKWKCVGR